MHQPVRIHDSDGNPITATNPLEVDVKTLTSPDIATMQDDIALIKADIAAIRAILES
jgi:hypothetical protein